MTTHNILDGMLIIDEEIPFYFISKCNYGIKTPNSVNVTSQCNSSPMKDSWAHKKKSGKPGVHAEKNGRFQKFSWRRGGQKYSRFDG